MSGQTLGHILEKLCVCSRGHIFSPNIMKLGQNVCLVKILDVFKNGSFWVQRLGQILEKPFVLCRGLIFGPLIMKPDQNVCLDEIRMNSKMGLVRSKARSLG